MSAADAYPALPVTGVANSGVNEAEVEFARLDASAIRNATASPPMTAGSQGVHGTAAATSSGDATGETRFSTDTLEDLPDIGGDMALKRRKKYTMHNPRTSWLPKEHAKFLRALKLYDRDWKKIEAYVGTKTVIQIRSHAQKYFLKASRAGHAELIPPVRRRTIDDDFQGTLKVKKKQMSSPGSLKRTGLLGSSQRTSFMQHDTNTGNVQQFDAAQILESKSPDFRIVYGFLTGVFESSVSTDDHAVMLQEMAPINKVTTTLLMNRLRDNMLSREMWQENLELMKAGCVTFVDAYEARQMAVESVPINSIYPSVKSTLRHYNAIEDPEEESEGGSNNDLKSQDETLSDAPIIEKIVTTTPR